MLGGALQGGQENREKAGISAHCQHRAGQCTLMGMCLSNRRYIITLRFAYRTCHFADSNRQALGTYIFLRSKLHCISSSTPASWELFLLGELITQADV